MANSWLIFLEVVQGVWKKKTKGKSKKNGRKLTWKEELQSAKVLDPLEAWNGFESTWKDLGVNWKCVKDLWLMVWGIYS